MVPSLVTGLVSGEGSASKGASCNGDEIGRDMDSVKESVLKDSVDEATGVFANELLHTIQRDCLDKKGKESSSKTTVLVTKIRLVA